MPGDPAQLMQPSAGASRPTTREAANAQSINSRCGSAVWGSGFTTSWSSLKTRSRQHPRRSPSSTEIDSGPSQHQLSGGEINPVSTRSAIDRSSSRLRRSSPIPGRWRPCAAIRSSRVRAPSSFYAAHRLESIDGYRIGVLCVWDTSPHPVGAFDVIALRDLALLAEAELIGDGPH
jgi:hypothetical protein